MGRGRGGEVMIVEVPLDDEHKKMEQFRYYDKYGFEMNRAELLEVIQFASKELEDYRKKYIEALK
jgi:hypothetical protein